MIDDLLLMKSRKFTKLKCTHLIFKFNSSVSFESISEGQTITVKVWGTKLHLSIFIVSLFYKNLIKYPSGKKCFFLPTDVNC
jgi:hypothetical protein